MNPPVDPNSPEQIRERASLKRKTTIVSIVLILMGAFVLFFVKQLPFPARVAIGLADVVIGMALLLFLRPKFDR